MKKIILTPEEKDRIAEAVKKAESETSGEISTALIPESSDYAFFELRASLFFAFIVYAGLIALYGPVHTLVSSLVWNSPLWFVPMVIGIITFLAGGLFYFISNIPALDRLIIPSGIMTARVRARAMRHFTESGLYATRDGTGILIFISLMERRVELIADRGISSKIDDSEWKNMVADLTASIGEGKLTEGLESAIARCGRVLSDHFPIKDDDTNELSDRIVLLED